MSDLVDGDYVVVTFKGDGEMIDTEYGEAVAFDLQVHESSSPDVEDGEPSNLLTSSKRFLTALAEHGAVDGRRFRVIRHGEGFNTEYQIEEAE